MNITTTNTYEILMEEKTPIIKPTLTTADNIHNSISNNPTKTIVAGNREEMIEQQLDK